MSLALLINGRAPADPSLALSAEDRGLHYGDGLFETALIDAGKVRFLQSHLDRLFSGCERLGLPVPERTQLLNEITNVVGEVQVGVLKIVLTRGVGDRGYRPARAAQTTRIVALYPHTKRPPEAVTARWCETRLGRNARLAGMKHLNRLEQVLAQQEWDDPLIGEGLMLDTEGELVCATASNVFIVREAVLATPDLRFCGVEGVMRSQVLRAAAQLGLAVNEEPLWPHDVEMASEVFLTSAVRGIRPIAALDSLRWNASPIASKLSAALQL
jgi:4-amino-4-deoxychorismate lyase